MFYLFSLLLFLIPLRGQTVTVDAHAASHPFPHFWEQAFGSGRAALSLRDEYRQDMDTVRQITGFEYVRFHAIFHDENGVYSEDAQGRPSYNFNQIDTIYDGLLAHHVKPYVELSFMPRQMAARPTEHAFWYKQLVAPPKDPANWAALIDAFAHHLVERYGIEEVATWYFEVWNEPNLDFWAGDPKWETYCDLYDTTARALKQVSPRLRVGGPSTAQAAWVGRFIGRCVKAGVPLDFVSTHVYANDSPQDVFGTPGPIDRSTMLARAVDKVYREVQASPRPDLPIHWSEFNASYSNEVEVTDSAFMGPWLTRTIADSDGKTALMSYWTFSDVFEEQGIFKAPFYGGFGLIANGSIPKASFHVFRLLHMLGNERLATDSDSALVTRRPGGSLAIALWNYADPGKTGPAKTLTLDIHGTRVKSARLWRVDAAHGSTLEVWTRMGCPPSPSPAQLAELRRAAAPAPAPAEPVPVSHGKLSVALPSPGLALVEITAAGK